MSVTILIPAAGFGRRMRGADKLLELVDGRPLLARTVARALEAADDVIVTLPALDHPRADAVAELPVRAVPVPEALEGMAASLRAGVAALECDVSGLLITPADMPDLTSDDFRRVINAFDAAPDRLVQATGADGTPGHPVIFPASCFDAISRLAGDEGARSVLRANKDRLVRVALAGDHALTDLDTPEAWAAWRAARGR
jgi:CTP:molybdopterin cytidylyltransferase MocA